jgi:hypothetical protein
MFCRVRILKFCSSAVRYPLQSLTPGFSTIRDVPAQVALHALQLSKRNPASKRSENTHRSNQKVAKCSFLCKYVRRNSPQWKYTSSNFTEMSRQSAECTQHTQFQSSRPMDAPTPKSTLPSQLAGWSRTKL